MEWSRKIAGHLTNYYASARREQGFQESRVDAIIEHKGRVSGYVGDKEATSAQEIEVQITFDSKMIIHL